MWPIARITGLDDPWARRLSRRPAAALAVVVLCAAVVIGLALGDMATGPRTTVGGLQIVPVLVAGWLLAPLPAVAVTVLAVVMRVVVVVAGAVDPTTGGIQCFVTVVVGVLTVVAADRTLVRLVMDRRARGIRRITRVLDSVRALGAEPEPDAALEEILAAATLLFAAPRGHRARATLALVEGDSVRVHLPADSEVVGESFAVRDNPAVARVIADGGSATVRSEHLRGSARTLADRIGGSVVAVTRIRAMGRPYGVLCIAFDDVRVIDPEELRLLEAMSHLAGIAVDAAAAVRLERDHAATLRVTAEHAAELEAVKREFLLLASHELRGPLAVARGYASMLGDGTFGRPAPSFRRPLRILEDKLGEIGSLVDDMLETARLDTGNLHLTDGEVDLTELVRSAVDAVRPVVTERHELEVELPGKPVCVRGDSQRLRRIAVNLLDNAVKYSPDGGAVHMAVERRGDRAVLSVRDHGLGIPEEALGVMFKRFGRIVTDRTSAIPGTGLGLYLCRELARAHGGDITVDSAEGEGSTFTLDLPLDGNGHR